MAATSSRGITTPFRNLLTPVAKLTNVTPGDKRVSLSFKVEKFNVSGARGIGLAIKDTLKKINKQLDQMRKEHPEAEIPPLGSITINLELDGKSKKTKDKCAQYLSRAFRLVPNLVGANFICKNMYDSDVAKILASLKTLETPPTHISLTREGGLDDLGKASIADLGSALAQVPLLSQLILQSLNLNEEQIRQFEEMMQENSSVQSLELNKLTTQDHLPIDFTTILKVNSTLNELKIILGEPETATSAIESLASTHSLEILTILGTPISDLASEALEIGLAANTSLKLLQLTGCGSSGLADHAIKGLKTNSSLETLQLDCSGITDAQVSVLVDSLCVNRSLRVLNFEMNLIDDEGAALIAEWLKTNPCLERLSLGLNEIHKKGAQALFSALAENHSLRTLDLSGNPCTDDESTIESQALLKKALETTNHTLTAVDSEFCDEEIRTLLERNEKSAVSYG
ncbi:MAG: hypothetical protein K2P51_05575 [Rhabdochlamydiaceae bacterium]|nr:hypothetical protein [Rhabdochlamydiaceae bacterium]